MDNSSTGFVDRLGWLRSVSGLSSREISARADLSPAYVGMLLRKEVENARIETLNAIARVFNVPAAWFVYGVGEAPAAEAVKAHVGAPGTPAGDVAQVVPDGDSGESDGDEADLAEARATLAAARADDTTAHPEFAAHPAQDTAAVA